MITVIRRVDEHWAEGRLNDRIGIFPISFVDFNDSAKWLLNNPPLAPQPFLATVTAPRQQQLQSSRSMSRSNEELARCGVTGRSHVSTTVGILITTASSTTVSSSGALLSLANSLNTPPVAMQNKRYSLTTLASGDLPVAVSVVTTASQRHSMELPLSMARLVMTSAAPTVATPVRGSARVVSPASVPVVMTTSEGGSGSCSAAASSRSKSALPAM